MALSNISKEHVNNLLLSLNDNKNNELEIVKKNHVNYAKLKLIAKQIKSLKDEAMYIIEESKFQNKLINLKTKFKIVSGNYYYLYQKQNEEIYLSLISPKEWTNNKDIFEGKYYYDFDKQFIKIENE